MDGFTDFLLTGVAFFLPSVKMSSGMFSCFDQPKKKEKLLKPQMMVHHQGLTW